MQLRARARAPKLVRLSTSDASTRPSSSLSTCRRKSETSERKRGAGHFRRWPAAQASPSHVRAGFGQGARGYTEPVAASNSSIETIDKT